MANPADSFDVPYRDRMLDMRGLLSATWISFFKSLFERVQPLGIERSFPLVNNQATPADITGMKVNARGVSQAIVEYLVQRITTGGFSVALVESGLLILTYNPTSQEWTCTPLNADEPNDSGVDFSVTADGQVQYESSSVLGTPSISRVVWRMRTLAGKNTQYSSQGTR